MKLACMDEATMQVDSAANFASGVGACAAPSILDQ